MCVSRVCDSEATSRDGTTIGKILSLLTNCAAEPTGRALEHTSIHPRGPILAAGEGCVDPHSSSQLASVLQQMFKPRKKKKQEGHFPPEQKAKEADIFIKGFQLPE